MGDGNGKREDAGLDLPVLRRDDALLLGRPPDRDRLLPPLHSQARAAPPHSALQGQVELPVPDEAAHDAGLLPLPAPPGTHRHARRRDGARPDGARRRDRRRDRGSDRQRAPRHDVTPPLHMFFLMTFMGLFMMLPGDFQAMAFEELFTVASIVVHYITNHVLFGTLDLMGTGVGEDDVDGGMME